jgi:hypothetical protein
MFKIVYICRAPILGKSVTKAFSKHGLGKFLTQKLFFWSESDPNPKIWETLFWDRVRWETFSRPNPKFWDLGFGTDLLCRGGDQMRCRTTGTKSVSDEIAHRIITVSATRTCADDVWNLDVDLVGTGFHDGTIFHGT